MRRLLHRRTGHQPETGPAVGDLTDRAAVRAALTGVDAVFLVRPLPDAAPAEGLIAELVTAAPRVVHLSSTAVTDAAVRQTDPMAHVHADMETLLRDAGLRPEVLRTDTLASTTRLGAAGPGGRRGVGTGRGAHGRRGRTRRGRADQVALLGAALRRPLRFRALPAGLAGERLLADGRPERLVAALIAAAERRPASDRVTDHVERLTGRPAGTFARWAADHAAEFGR
ncbi:NmrA family transcriptional regulator [Streptomyces sp. RFCAC02]|uniref:NmrA family transcriptional regulator n=1 Tax=Streptomyces sp. RFCAC02 TaxID=2499143 RepID=UPI001F0F8481|nr:NmrA family transcriptional regulator [Streptomyces sp. RFCAC02]